VGLASVLEQSSSLLVVAAVVRSFVVEVLELLDERGHWVPALGHAVHHENEAF